MRNIFRDIMLHAFDETAGVPMWKMWLALVVMSVCAFVATVGAIVAVFMAGGRTIDWVFVLIVTAGILALATLLVVYRTYHWAKRQR